MIPTLRPAADPVISASTERQYALSVETPIGFTAWVEHVDLVVGRAAERDALQAALRSARAGVGGLVLLSGPPGIGKSRVAELVAHDAAGAGVPVRWGRCLADDAVPPLWPWRRALPDQDLAPAAPLTPEAAAAARFQLLARCEDALAAAAEPDGLVVLLEDVHWADEASVALLAHLAGDVRRTRLLLVATLRDATHGPLTAALPSLLSLPGVTALRLGPLPAHGVAAYLSGVLGRAVDPRAVALVHERSGGNPLYVRALAGVLGDDLLVDASDTAAVEARVAASPELRHVVSAALRGLPAPVREALDVAAVLGEEVDAGLLAAVLDLPVPDVLRRMEGAAGLLAPVPEAPGHQRFLHALVRDGVLADLGHAARTAWHLRVAQALEREVASPSLLAFHWLHAATEPEQLTRAVHWSRTAAAQSGLVAPADAALLLRRGLGAARRAHLPDAPLGDLLVELATAEWIAGQIADSLEHSTEAGAAAERAGLPALQARAALVLSGIGNHDTAARVLELCDRALAAEPPAPDLRARLLARRAQVRCTLGPQALAQEEAAAALAAAEACGDRVALHDAVHATLDSLDALAPPEQREELADRALALSDREQPLGRLWPLLWRLDAACMRGEPALVDGLVQQLELLVGTCELPLARWHLLRVRASRAALRGDPDAAAAANDEASALAGRLQEPAMTGMSHAFGYCLARQLGAPDALPGDWLEHLHAAPDMPIVQATGASALLLLGDREDAARRARPCLDQLPRLARDGQWHGTLYALVDVAVELADLASCAVLHDLLLPSAAWSGGPGSGNMWCPGSGWTPVARLRAALGRHDEAVQAYEAAVEADARSGAVADAAHARIGLAELLAGADRERARSLAEEALAVATRSGLRAVRTRAEALLRVADPLSPREREVADLVARSLSNREVAQRLFLSERTVESHVRSVLAKLGLRSRVDLVAQRASSG